MKKLSKINDAIFCYVLAWYMIIFFPLWLPFYIARKLYKDARKDVE